MKIFIDSADLEEIEAANSWGIIDGITTNPTLIKKAVEKYSKKSKKMDMEEYIKKILVLMKGKSVSLEVVDGTYEEMVKEGIVLYDKFKKFGNVYVKIPCNTNVGKGNNLDGIKAISELSKRGIPINCTLIFDPEQAILAAKAGAKYVSPFVGRFDDYLRDKNKIKYKKEDYFPAEGLMKKGKKIEDQGIFSGVELVRQCKEIFRKEKIKCEVLAASIRSVRQFGEVMMAGADIITLPFHIIEESTIHDKTKEGMEKFLEDTVKEYKDIMTK